MKDPESEPAFSKTFQIGKDYSVSDLPDSTCEEVWNMNPGFELGVWKALDENAANIVTNATLTPHIFVMPLIYI